MIVTLNFLAVLFIIPATSKLEPYIVGGKEGKSRMEPYMAGENVKSKMEPYIVGGKDVKIKQYPHSLFLYIELKGKEPHVCGGSILTQHILLTVAHCFEDCQDGVITAYAGHENIQKMTASRQISSFDIHKDYVSRHIHPDIALGYTEKPWILNKLKRVILINSYSSVKEATVAGWGVTNDVTGEQQLTLKAVTQHIQPSDVCEKAGSSYGPGMMCAMSYETYPSHGDSGSAFVLNNGQQIGAVSWRSKKMKELVVYTNISFYYNWIRLHSKRLRCLNKD